MRSIMRFNFFLIFAKASGVWLAERRGERLISVATIAVGVRVTTRYSFAAVNFGAQYSHVGEVTVTLRKIQPP